MWHDSNESRGFFPFWAPKHFIEHLSNSSYRFSEENYIAIIIVTELSPSPTYRLYKNCSLFDIFIRLVKIQNLFNILLSTQEEKSFKLICKIWPKPLACRHCEIKSLFNEQFNIPEENVPSQTSWHEFLSSKLIIFQSKFNVLQGQSHPHFALPSLFCSVTHRQPACSVRGPLCTCCAIKYMTLKALVHVWAIRASKA